jgi:hypothetical protein
MEISTPWKGLETAQVNPLGLYGEKSNAAVLPRYFIVLYPLRAKSREISAKESNPDQTF